MTAEVYDLDVPNRDKLLNIYRQDFTAARSELEAAIRAQDNRSADTVSRYFRAKNRERRAWDRLWRLERGY